MRRRTRIAAIVFGALVCCLALPTALLAQSGISGIVKDTSGAVLPGVTVEAASPALIEQTRSATTDAQGRYDIIDLRPGTYTVTFSLAGFTTVKREGLALATAFTATVNADMKVGGVEESITVTGEAPLVDVQRSKNETVLPAAILNATPLNWRSVVKYTALLPGVEAAEGGTGRGLATQAATLAIHGGLSAESNMNLEGVAVRHNTVGGQMRFVPNQAMIEDISVSIGGAGADQQMGGIVQNIVQKSGGNMFSGYTYFHYLNDSFSGENTSGGSSGRLIESWDFNPAFGGPIKKDKLWFYGSYRTNGNEVDAGVKPNLTPNAVVYTPNLNADNASFRVKDINYSLKLTYQATPRNQFSFYADQDPRYWWNRNVSATVAPEAGDYANYLPNYIYQLLWKSPLTNKWLLESNVSYLNGNSSQFPIIAGNTSCCGTNPDQHPEIYPAINELGTATVPAFQYRSQVSAFGNLGTSPSFRTTSSVTHVTGSHTTKFGMDFYNLGDLRDQHQTGDIVYTFRGGVPSSVTLYAPNITNTKVKADMGIYVQDRWTFNRLTANVGLRFDYFNAYAAAFDEPGNRWVAPKHYDQLDNIPNWKDLSPRFGGVFDLFGDGKTAIKGTLNRYVNGEAVTTAQSANQVTTSVLTATRTWNDSFYGVGDPRRGNFEPDCDFTNLTQNAECGPISDTNFAQANPRATVRDPDLLEGYRKRGYQWEGSLGVTQQVNPKLAVTFAYYRRWFGNFTITHNQAYGSNPSIYYDPYCAPLPSDSRLPGGGGNQVCGFYDINSTARAFPSQNLITFSKPFGDQSQVYNGFDLTMSARFKDGQVSGGMVTGRTETKKCFINNSPQDMLFCDTKPPFQAQLKFSGVYQLPWYAVQLSGSFQSIPGVSVSPTLSVTNAQIFPTLNRNLSAGATSTVTLGVIAPGTVFGQRYNTSNVRFAKIIRVARSEWTVGFDILNMFNSDGAVAVQNVIGATYLQPTAIVNARYYKASVQYTF